MAAIFNLGVIPLQPRDCGRRYDDVSDEELRGLSAEPTPAEMASPFFAYYRKQMPVPPPALTASYEDGPMDASLGYLPQEIGARFLAPKSESGERGYCVLPNGVGYVAMKIDQPGRTDEKQAKFNNYFAPTGSLAYKIWHTEAHIMHFVDGAYEDFGWGPQKIRFQAPIDFQYLGMDEQMIRSKDPCTKFLMCNSSSAYNPFDPERKIEYSCMLRQLRETPNGRELRIRYWFGMAIDANGVILTNLQPGDSTPLEHMRLMAKHCAWEYTNEAYLVEKYWTDSMWGK